MVRIKKFPPLLTIVLSFVLVVFLGSCLLILPISVKEGVRISYLDALFTSASATCVTGLVSTPPLATTFSVFGKVVIYFLIQIGGLGVITISIAILSIFGYKFGISDRFLMKDALNQNGIRGIVRLVLAAIIISFSFQFVGTMVNLIVFTKRYSFGKALLISLFHASSAFNNAGFDIVSCDGSSLMSYKDDIILNLNTAFLIIFGGLGFLVHYEIITRRSWKKFSSHTKIVLKMTFFLLIFGFLLLKIIAYNKVSWLQAFFSSVSSRTAGFQTVDLNVMVPAFSLVTIILMYIGVSPASTGGGIKTTTLYTILKTTAATATGRPPLIYNKRISQTSIIKALTLIVASLAWIMFVVVIISSIEYNNVKLDHSDRFVEKIIFEVFSAFTTTGKSFGITGSLHPVSKLFLILSMLIGRVGPITFISVFAKRLHQFEESYYLEDTIIVG